jgi:hypothetical protein
MRGGGRGARSRGSLGVRLAARRPVPGEGPKGNPFERRRHEMAMSCGSTPAVLPFRRRVPRVRVGPPGPKDTRGLLWGIAGRDGGLMATKRAASGGTGGRRGARRAAAETAISREARRSGATDEERRFVDVDPWAVLLERLMEVPEENVPAGREEGEER